MKITGNANYVRSRQECSFLFSVMLEVLASAIRQEEFKGKVTGNKEVDLSLLIDMKTVQIQNLRGGSPKKVTRTNKDFIKITGYKVSNLKKSIVFVYTKQQMLEN